MIIIITCKIYFIRIVSLKDIIMIQILAIWSNALQVIPNFIIIKLIIIRKFALIKKKNVLQNMLF